MNSTLSVSSSSANQPIRRQPRGSINRRACQKCRHLKIKCDGDAENNLSCSNCDYGTCVYDKSPRKNRQVEKLTAKVENLENTLKQTQTNLEMIQDDYFKKTEEYNLNVETLKMEKEILNLLFDCYNLFAEHPIVFNQLRRAIHESRCWPILLPVIHTLLSRLSQNNNDTNSIIAMLTNIAENTMNYCNPDDTFNSTLPQNFIEEVFAQMNSNQSFNATRTSSENVSTGMANLALRSPSEAGSDMSNLTLPDYKIDLISSPLLTPNPNIDITSPHLTPIDQEAAFFSHSGSEYGNSPVNDYTMDFTQTILFDFGGVYDVPPSSYGSNSSDQ